MSVPAERAGPSCIPPERASGRLPEKPQRAVLRSLCSAGALLALAGGATFAVCGLWQAIAVVRRVSEVSRTLTLAPAPPPTPPTRSMAPVFAASSTTLQRETVSVAPRVEAVLPVPRPVASASDAAEPMLTAARASVLGRSGATFEAEAEASERVIPVGMGDALADADTSLILGLPPPPSYPRVSCDDVFVYIVSTVQGAPERSAASIGIGKKGPARFRRPGQRIDDWNVIAISDDWTGLNPSVWLEKDGSVCRAELAGNASRVHQPAKPRPRPKARRRRR